MKKSQRIKVLVDLKAAQAKTALEALGVSQRKWLAMETQIEGLKTYRQDYQNKLDQLGAGGTQITQLLEFKSFIEKLDKAIAGQEHTLQAIQMELNFKKKAWETMHHKTQGLQKICDGAARVEAKQEDRLEQLAQDERAGRLGRTSSLA